MATKLKSIFQSPVFVGASARSPIGRFGGSLTHLSAPELAAIVLKGAYEKYPQTQKPDAVFLGHARQAGAGPNPARQAVLFSGLDFKIPAYTVNQACASGITTILTGAEKIALGKIQSAWCGGVESMSNTPYFLMNVRQGIRLGHDQVLDGMWKDGFYCPMAQMLMGQTVETFIAAERKISRASQDEYALESQKRAQAAWEKGQYSEEVIPITLESVQACFKSKKNLKKFVGLNRDEHMKPETTLKKLSELPAVFDRKNGTLTAGNSSGITDGAAFVHVSNSKESFTQAEILDYENIALEPEKMGLGPVQATQNLLKRQGLKIQDLDVIELNEAFAAQVLACQKDLSIPSEKLNPRGGAIALGHPIGATGARIAVTLLHQLKKKPGSLGLLTLCVSGGQGVSVLFRGISSI